MLMVSEIPRNRIWHLNFAETKTKSSTETHINHDQIHNIRNSWLGPIFYSPGDSHTKGFLALLYLGLEGITKVDTDPKGRFVCFNVTPSKHRVLCIYTPSGCSTREQLARGRSFEGLQNYMENKNEGNKSKIMLGDFNCTIDKMDKHGENKTQRLYRCCSNYALSKLIVGNRLEDLWRRENPDSPEFTSHDGFFGKDPA